MSALRCVLGVSVVLAIGCGGASTSDVNGEGGPGSGTSDGGGGGQTGDSSVSGNPPPSGGDDSGVPAVGADGGLISPPVDDDAGLADDGSPGRGVTPPPVRAGDGGANQIECMGKVCDSTTEICCAVRNTESCMTAAACKGDKLACSGTNSCAMGVCCEEATGGREVVAKCEATCPRGAIQLCSSDADCTGAGETCSRAGVCEMERPVRDAGVPVRPPTPPFRDGGLRFGDGG